MVTDYQMTTDLGPCPRHGLSVAGGVTLDCRHYVIRGPGTPSQHYGVSLSGDTSGATVKNCEVTGFRHGIRLRGVHRNRILDNNVHHNGDTIAHSGYGIDVAAGSTDNLFQGNHIHHNADEGIHIGTGSHRNMLIGNQVYDNFRENIYVLGAERGVFKENLTQGRGNSLYLKHAALHRFENNTFRDRTAVIRGDSHDNQFIGNDFVNTGVHFEALKEEAALTHPTKNLVSGGKIAGAQHCLRFTGASGNLIQDTQLSGCSVGVSSTAAGAGVENTLIGVTLHPREISLDDKSLLRIGWHLAVSVKDAGGSAIGGARVRCFDVHKNLVFDASTAPDGKIPTQDVIQYTQNGPTRTSHTPHTLHVTATRATAIQEVSIDSHKAVTVTMPPAGR